MSRGAAARCRRSSVRTGAGTELAGTAPDCNLFYIKIILRGRGTAMTKKTLTNLALAAGCMMALAGPTAQAQMVDSRILMHAPRVHADDGADWMAGANNAESAQYDRLL